MTGITPLGDATEKCMSKPLRTKPTARDHLILRGAAIVRFNPSKSQTGLIIRDAADAREFVNNECQSRGPMTVRRF